MIAQKGCMSEKLLRARDRGEFISYSEWETVISIETRLLSTIMPFSVVIRSSAKAPASLSSARVLFAQPY
jgi:hypothetical protein